MICICRVEEKHYFPLEKLSTELYKEVSELKETPTLPDGYKRQGIKITQSGTILMQIGVAHGSVTVSPFKTLEHADLFRYRFFESDWYKEYKSCKYKNRKSEVGLAKPRKGSYAEHVRELIEQVLSLKSLVQELSAEFFEVRDGHDHRLTKLENDRAKRLEEILARSKEK